MTRAYPDYPPISEAGKRNAIIEECARVAESYFTLTTLATPCKIVAAAIRALKDNP